jgi:hypothetical protein
VVLRRDRLLDLEDQVAGPPDVVGGVEDGGARGDVVLASLRMEEPTPASVSM